MAQDGAAIRCLIFDDVDPADGEVLFRSRCFENNCVEADLDSDFGDNLGRNGVISGPNWSKDLLCLAGKIAGVIISLA